MARISGRDIPNDKRVEIALTYIYGIGRSISNKILKSLEIDPNIRIKNLTDNEINKIREEINKNYLVEGDLRKEISFNIKRLMEINSYRGIRHRKGLPVRGQNTKNNARTRKGVKKTVTINKKITTDKKQIKQEKQEE